MLTTIPFSEEMEKALILSVLTDPSTLPKVHIDSTDFYKVKHQEIWKVIQSLDVDNIDSLSVEDRLREDTLPYFKELVADADRLLPSTSNVMFYAETVKNKSKMRAGIELGQKIIAECYSQQDSDEAIQNLEDMFANFLRRRIVEDKSESSLDAFHKFIESLQTREPEDPNSVRTGFHELDLMIQRIEGLTVLGARPGMGKTAFAANIMMNVAKADQKVIFFSLEQPEDQIFERMLAAESGVPLEDIKLGVHRNDETSVSYIESAEKRLRYLFNNIHIDDRANVGTSYITSVARQKKYEWGEVGLIVVDYLHLLQLKSDNKVDALGDAAKELRGLGKELGCPVLLLSQLKRQGDQGKEKKSKRPDLEDLRASGEIEQVADMVWFLYRDSYYEQPGLAPEEDLIEVLVRKNRNGRQGVINLTWLPTIQKFEDVERMSFKGRK